MLRKSFLIIGIVLLVLGFFFFYWASRVDWDYMTTYEGTVVEGGALVGDFGFGNCYSYPVTPTIQMRPNDFHTVQCTRYTIPQSGSQTLYIVLFQNLPSNTTVLNYGTGLVVYTSHQVNIVRVYPYVAVLVNPVIYPATISVTVTLHHYEKPQWVYFGIDIVLSLLAIIPIFKSNSKPKPINAEDSSQAERGI